MLSQNQEYRLSCVLPTSHPRLFQLFHAHFVKSSPGPAANCTRESGPRSPTCRGRSRKSYLLSCARMGYSPRLFPIWRVGFLIDRMRPNVAEPRRLLQHGVSRTGGVGCLLNWRSHNRRGSSPNYSVFVRAEAAYACLVPVLGNCANRQLAKRCGALRGGHEQIAAFGA
jgi:hypothetical protein